MIDFDPRYEWEETRTLDGRVEYFCVGCRHQNLTPVEALVTGETVAYLCLDCDQHFPLPGSTELPLPGRTEYA